MEQFSALQLEPVACLFPPAWICDPGLAEGAPAAHGPSPVDDMGRCGDELAIIPPTGPDPKLLRVCLSRLRGPGSGCLSHTQGPDCHRWTPFTSGQVRTQATNCASDRNHVSYIPLGSCPDVMVRRGSLGRVSGCSFGNGFVNSPLADLVGWLLSTILSHLTSGEPYFSRPCLLPGVREILILSRLPASACPETKP